MSECCYSVIQDNKSETLPGLILDCDNVLVAFTTKHPASQSETLPGLILDCDKDGHFPLKKTNQVGNIARANTGLRRTSSSTGTTKAYRVGNIARANTGLRHNGKS